MSPLSPLWQEALKILFLAALLAGAIGLRFLELYDVVLGPALAQAMLSINVEGLHWF